MNSNIPTSVLRKQKYLKMGVLVQRENSYSTWIPSMWAFKIFLAICFELSCIFVASWEIERSHLHLADVIGEGAFGRVLRAFIMESEADPLTNVVAVKMLKG
jgi:hypothetical protein